MATRDYDCRRFGVLRATDLMPRDVVLEGLSPEDVRVYGMTLRQVAKLLDHWRNTTGTMAPPVD